MAKNTENIEREIEVARDQLAATLDELSVRANPKRIVATTKQAVITQLNTPAVKYALVGVGALVAVLVVRKIVS